jgi:hypothetical protein
MFLQGAEIWTPLLFASYKNQIDVSKLLIQHGALIDFRNNVNIIIVLPTHYILLCAYEIVDSGSDCIFIIRTVCL